MIFIRYIPGSTVQPIIGVRGGRVRHGDCFPRSASVRDRHFSFYLLYPPLATCSSSSSISSTSLSDRFCMLHVCRALNGYFKTGLCLTFAAVPALFGADDIV